MTAMHLRNALHRLLLGAAGLLAGCASMAPPYERPPAAVAPQFPTATPDTAGPAAADLEWRQVFTDSRQQRLIELALENNRDLRLAALNVEQAQARWRIQHASLWPTVNAGIGGNRQPLPNGSAATTYSVGLLVRANRRRRKRCRPRRAAAPPRLRWSRRWPRCTCRCWPTTNC
jgi:outer membrane protein, multidrug efflux system